MDCPSLTERVALSEAELDRGMPRALLFREGLLPYAETVVGSRRLCGAVHRGVGSVSAGQRRRNAAGLLHGVPGGLQSALALSLLAFLLLWTLPVLVLADWAGRY